ncbi:MAG: DUF2807 domain-containing protein [Bacteroidetes bacterium]|nr:MAG: DUF2807 domain-containing protein [Bacteroidota bacterium]
MKKIALARQGKAGGCVSEGILKTQNPFFHKTTLAMIKNMQNLLTLLCMGVLLWSLSSCEDVLGIKGKGNIVTEVRNVTDFHAVDIATNGRLELRVDSVYHVEVQCEESIIAYLQTIEDNGVLKIHFDRDVYDVDGLKIVVSAPAWDAIAVSGSVNVMVPDAIVGDQLDLSITGSGDMDIYDVNFEKVNMLITGSGDISIDGVADHLFCNITGSGNIDALGCPVLTANINISGSGDVRLEVSESLDVTISGSGNVEYRGNPQINSNISGSGTIRKI